ncbi:hypothetical protein HPB47_019608, partial [Ixodes persulcatus]
MIRPGSKSKELERRYECGETFVRGQHFESTSIRCRSRNGFIPGATMTVLDPSGNQGAELGTSAN